MATIDLRECLNAISDVIVNRPPPLREFDQIYMKAADLLLQAELVGRWFDKRSVLFVGDGDALALCATHLHQQKLLPKGPSAVHVLDFDERIVNSINNFADVYNLTCRVRADLYNVADPLPERYWQFFDAFYTNPPFGASNGGRSVESFLLRAIEGVGKGAVGCVVVADYPELNWTGQVLSNTQQYLLNQGFLIAELLPQFHHYHLDDTPDLTSCSMIVRRLRFGEEEYRSQRLEPGILGNFYGAGSPLAIQRVRDLRSGGKFPSRDHELVRLER
jgi:predicted methyltransferase